MDWPFGGLDADIVAGSVRDITDGLSWALLGALLLLFPLVVLFYRATRRRHFWCAHSRREAEVEFEERGLPGFRWMAAVKSCTVFDPPTAVGCSRRCLEAEFRRRWPPALPVGRPDQERSRNT